MANRFTMENQRNPADENLFERDTRDDFSSGPLSRGEREDAKSDNEDDDTRLDEELELNEDLDEE